MTKRVYLFSGLNAFYSGFWDCQESPLEPGVYIQPEESTEVEPPTFDVNTHSCNWDGAKWTLVEIPKAEPQSNAKTTIPNLDPPTVI